jgi:hypothetical protein
MSAKENSFIPVRIDASRPFFIEVDAESFADIFARASSLEQAEILRLCFQKMTSWPMQKDYIAMELRKEKYTQTRDALKEISTWEDAPEQTKRNPVALVGRRFWVFWWHPPGGGEIELHYPWWVSGNRGGDGAPSICAAIIAEGEDEVKAKVLQAYIIPPENPLDFRFVVERGSNWAPFGDRFPRAEWMVWPE